MIIQSGHGAIDDAVVAAQCAGHFLTDGELIVADDGLLRLSGSTATISAGTRISPPEPRAGLVASCLP
jgi:hypothetical protein